MTHAISGFSRRLAPPILALGLLFALLLALTAAPAAAQTSPEDQADLARVEDYLNGIRSMDARFLQIAPDGALSEGRLYLRRPGRLRFEYAEPSPILVVADGVWMVYHDRELKQTTRLPLAATPLSVLVRERISLGEEVRVSGIERGPGTLRITLQDGRRAREGHLTLIFADEPLILKQWVVTDAQGLDTTITLHEIRLNLPLPSGLFVFHDDSPRGQTFQ